MKNVYSSALGIGFYWFTWRYGLMKTSKLPFIRIKLLGLNTRTIEIAQWPVLTSFHMPGFVKWFISSLALSIYANRLGHGLKNFEIASCLRYKLALNELHWHKPEMNNSLCLLQIILIDSYGTGMSFH